jgi:hypothetical protein
MKNKIVGTHTPGPWRICNLIDTGKVVIRDEAFEIWKCQRQGDIQMVVVDPDGDVVAAYKWAGLAAARGLYRAVDAHLRKPGATLHNYQW